MDFDLFVKSIILKHMIILIDQIFVFGDTFQMILTNMIHLEEFEDTLTC